jgi:hypothetical protein
MKVDNSKSASASLAAPWVSPAELPKSPCAGDEVAQFRINSQSLLELLVLFICQVVANMASEGRGFDEFHQTDHPPSACECNHTPLAYNRQWNTITEDRDSGEAVMKEEL